MDICFLGQINVTGINHDQFAAPLYSLTDLHTNNRMCLLRVGTYHHDQVRLLSDIRNRISHCS